MQERTHAFAMNSQRWLLDPRAQLLEISGPSSRDSRDRCLAYQCGHRLPVVRDVPPFNIGYSIMGDGFVAAGASGLHDEGGYDQEGKGVVRERFGVDPDTSTGRSFLHPLFQLSIADHQKNCGLAPCCGTEYLAETRRGTGRLMVMLENWRKSSDRAPRTATLLLQRLVARMRSS